MSEEELIKETMMLDYSQLVMNNVYCHKEIERLNKELEVAKTNEETYRLEMLDITKRLGLDEETLFDDVKDKAERLNNIINELEKYYEEELKNLNYSEDKIYAQGIHDTIISHKYKLQELKGDGSNDN